MMNTRILEYMMRRARKIYTDTMDIIKDMVTITEFTNMDLVEIITTSFTIMHRKQAWILTRREAVHAKEVLTKTSRLLLPRVATRGL